MNVIVHMDEIFLKGSNQPVFYRQLKNNLEKLLPTAQASRIESGIWLESVKPEQLPRLALIPGFANYAVAIKTANDFKEIKKGVDRMFGGIKAIKTFRISAERSFKNFPFSSMAVAKEIGEYAQTKYGWKVDLENPELNIHIAIGKTSAYIYGNTQNGAGGLPTGTAGKVLALLSGGIDSPVAAYKIMCRGGQVDLIHFQNQTQVTEAVSEKIFDLAKTLSGYQPEIKLFIAPFADIQKQIIMNVPAPYRMIVTRRIFNKIADKIARENNYLALVSGDSLGQVASQTLENMAVISRASDLLKLAPLMGTNKKDIIDTARKIGTLDISSRPYEDCCSLFVAKHPITKSRLNDVLKYEGLIDESVIEKIKIISYRICSTK